MLETCMGCPLTVVASPRTVGVEFIVERMHDDPEDGAPFFGQRHGYRREILAANVRLSAVERIDNPGIGRRGRPRTRLLADDGVIWTIVAEHCTNRCISELVHIGDDFAPFFMLNFEGHVAMLQ